jgi:hypothetical protein
MQVSLPLLMAGAIGSKSRSAVLRKTVGAVTAAAKMIFQGSIRLQAPGGTSSLAGLPTATFCKASCRFSLGGIGIQRKKNGEFVRRIQNVAPYREDGFLCPPWA